jgi:hypothetical protein
LRHRRLQEHSGWWRPPLYRVAEAEASIRTVGERHAERAITIWANLHALPDTNPLSKLKTRERRRFTSPLQKIALASREQGHANRQNEDYSAVGVGPMGG